MTVKVAGAWEMGWLTPITEYDLWYFPMMEYAVDEWCMFPVTGISKRGVTEYPDLKGVIADNPELTPIYLDENGEIGMDEFIHPENCIYILGKASCSSWVQAGSPPGASVRIATPTNSGRLWPHQVASLILNDRMKKV